MISFTVETDGRLVNGETLARGHRDRGSRDVRRARILHDQLRASDAFRRRAAGGRGLDSSASTACEPMRRPRATPNSMKSDNARCGRSARSRPALPRSQALVPGDAHARRLLRHRPPSCPGDLRSLPAAAGAQRLNGQIKNGRDFSRPFFLATDLALAPRRRGAGRRGRQRCRSAIEQRPDVADGDAAIDRRSARRRPLSDTARHSPARSGFPSAR